MNTLGQLNLKAAPPPPFFLGQQINFVQSLSSLIGALQAFISAKYL